MNHKIGRFELALIQLTAVVEHLDLKVGALLLKSLLNVIADLWLVFFAHQARLLFFKRVNVSRSLTCILLLAETVAPKLWKHF